MGEPAVLPDDVSSALRQIKNDGAVATLAKDQLREVETRAAGQSWPGFIAPAEHSSRNYVFRGEQIRVWWKWKLDLGSLRRDPLPIIMAENAPQDQPLLMGPAGQLLRDFPPSFFEDTLWFPHQPQDAKAVLAWIEEWAGLALRRRHFAFNDYSEAAHHALEGIGFIVERLEEGAELTARDWLWIGRAWERLEIETKSELPSHSPTANVRAYHKDRSDRRRAQGLRADKDREQLLDYTTEVEKWAPSIVKESPGLRRASIAKRVLERWPRSTAPGARVIEQCLDALKAEGRINFPDPKPRGRNVKKKAEGPDSKRSSS